MEMRTMITLTDLHVSCSPNLAISPNLRELVGLGIERQQMGVRSGLCARHYMLSH